MESNFNENKINYSSLFAGLNVVKEISDKSEARLNTKLAPKFNYFDLFNPNENKLSYLLADLLDPEGWHGQGGAFLERFCQSIGANFATPPFKLQDVAVHTEAATTSLQGKENRRIDVVIEHKKWAIGIENKPWAGDQQDQLLDYFEHLKNISKPNKNFLLLYLSGDEKLPADFDKLPAKADKTENGRVVLMRYRGHGFDDFTNKKGEDRKSTYAGFEAEMDFVDWLEKCRAICKAPHVAVFLEHFIQYTKKQFSQNNEDNMTELEKNFVSYLRGANKEEDQKRVKLALSINQTALRNNITDGFLRKLREAFLVKYNEKCSQEITTEDKLVGKLSAGGLPCLSFYHSDWPPIDDDEIMCIYLETVGTITSNEKLYWGTLCPKNSPYRERFEQSITENLGGIGKLTKWGWWNYEDWADYKDDDILITMMDLDSNTVDNYIETTVDRWLRMVKVINEVIDKESH